MFGKKNDPVIVSINAPSRTEYVTRTVHEHRAPTDESVRLLREMEGAARQQVERSINVGGNGFECVVTIEKEGMSMDTIAKAIFKLNGIHLTATARIPGWDQQDAVKLAEKLRDEVALKIAAVIVGPAFSKALRS